MQFTQNITKGGGLIQTQLACSSLKNVTKRTKRPVNNYICSISFNKYYFSWMFNEFGFFSILIFFKLWKNYFDTKILCCSNSKYFFYKQDTGKKIKPIILDTKNVEIKMTNYHQKLIEQKTQKVASFQTKF